MELTFDGLVKVTLEPAVRQLAAANARLQTPLSAPASALPEVVLEELWQKAALIDLLRLLGVLLPPRERVWWACLAARDYLGAAPLTPSVTAAEAWVFKPGDGTRQVAVECLQAVPVEDDTGHCAMAVAYADGRLGPGEMARYLAPPGAAQAAAFAMNMVALGARSDMFQSYGRALVARGIDIARGGNGRVPVPEQQGEAG